MALTNLSQITTSGISTLADVSLNSITGVDATFTGNVSIGGTLTYEDVTNIDSVGLITARSGIRVQTGTATTALIVEGNGRITGILTVGSSSLTLNGSTNVVNVGTALTLGHTQGLQFHTQNLHSQGFDVNNVNATGIVTATTFIGNLTGTASNASGATGDFSIADKIVHTGDTNTAIRFPAADTVTVETGGSERLRIDSSGRVLVGVTTARTILSGYTPSLQVEGTANSDSSVSIVENISSVAGPSLWFGKTRGSSLGANTVVQSGDELGTIVFNGADGTDVQSMGAFIRASVDGTPGSNDMPGRLTFHTTADGAASPTERLRITSAGLVGIGTDNPGNYDTEANDFVVRSANHTGITIASSGSDQRCNLYFSDGTSSTQKYVGGLTYDHSDNSMLVRTAASERLRITSGGNVGIGITNPESYSSAGRALVVGDPNSYSGMTIVSKGSGDYPEGSLYFADGLSGNAGRGRIVYHHGDDALYFSTSSVEKLRITSAGRVGIGKTNPSAILQVAGTNYQTIRLENTDNGANGPYIELYNNSSSPADNDYLGIISFKNNNSADEEITYAQIRSQSVDITDGTEDGILTFHTRNAGTFGEKLRVTSDGKVGINQTSPTADLEVAPAGSSTSSTIFIHAPTHNSSAVSEAVLKFGYGHSGSPDAVSEIKLVETSTNSFGGDLTFSVPSNNGSGGSTTSEALRILSDGAVIVGDGTNWVKYVSDANFQITDNTNPKLVISNPGNATFSLAVGTNNDLTFRDESQGADRMKIDYSTGYIGIGTDAYGNVDPLAPLHVSSYSPTTAITDHGTLRSASQLLLQTSNNVNNSRSGLMFSGALHSTDGCSAGIIANHENVAEDSETTSLSFYTSHTETLGERLRVNGQGRLYLKAVGGAGVIADFQEGTSATDSESLIAVTTGYSAGSNEGSARFGAKRTGNGNAAHFIVSTRETSSNIASGWYNRLYIKDNSQFQYCSYRAHKYSNEGASTSMYKFRLAINMVGSTAYTIRLRGMGNGAHHVRLMASHWTSSYQLVKESYYYTDTYSGLSEDSIKNVSSGAQGAWSVARPTNGQTGYTTDLIITKSAGSYGGGHIGMIEITTPSDLRLVSIT